MKTNAAVPDFFRDESDAALRSQAKWLEQSLGLDTAFLAKVLHEKESLIAVWKQHGDLPPESAAVFQELWRMVLHLLSFYDRDEQRLRHLLGQAIDMREKQIASMLLLPPWCGTSLRTFLEVHGLEAVQKINRWLMSVRFGEPYAALSIAD